MSSASGIPASPELIDQFARSGRNVRFFKVSIKNELLVPDGAHERNGDLKSDLRRLQSLVDDNVPAYILVRLDEGLSEWLAISYVPDTAKIRDKMLYASSRSALTKALGENRFKDTLFATSKNDLTPEGYDAHVAHTNAPHPLSAREAEMAEIRAAERAAGSVYEGSRARKTHVGGVGLAWSSEAEAAVKQVTAANARRLVLLTIDPATETIVLKSSSLTPVTSLGSSIPQSEPSYAFYSWSSGGHDATIFIYSCPSNSPIKFRMLFSSAVGTTVNAAKGFGITVTKKLETSDPEEIDDKYLQSHVTPALSPASGGAVGGERQAFAKPRGPQRPGRRM